MTVFLIIGIIGLVIVGVSLLFGEAIEGLLDLDFLGGDLFSIASIAAFLGAFGFGGVISLSILDVTWIAAVVGLVVGVLAGWGATALTRWLKRGESAGTFRSDAMIGAAGRVITAIPQDGYGEVRVYVGGRSHKRAAKAERAIPSGTEVWVSNILSPTAVEVMPAAELDPPTT